MYTTIKIEQESPTLSIGRSCECLGVNKRGYVKWIQGQIKTNQSDPYEMKLRGNIQEIALEFPRYGYRRITWELRHRGYAVNYKRVLRLMKADNLLCAKRIFKPQTTESSHCLRIYPNLAKDLTVNGVNQLWVADITYIRLFREFVYLAVIIDIYSRKCVGWELGRNIDIRLTLNALERALTERKGIELTGLIHHSDRGVQYASNEYVERLMEHGMQVSMGRKGNPYDNAYAESFIKTLKYEEVYLCEYESYDDAYLNIQTFIERVYNEKRLHSSIGYITPNEYENKIALNRCIA